MRKLTLFFLLVLSILALPGRAQVNKPAWTINPSDFSSDMEVFIQMFYTPTATAITSGGMVGAFIDGVLAGVKDLGKTSPNGKYVFQTRVYGNDAVGKSVVFMFYDTGRDQVFDVTEKVTFAVDGILGNATTPRTFHTTDATLSDLKIDGTTVPGFAPRKLIYDIILPYTTTLVPVVTATLNDPLATKAITPTAVLPGTTKVVVTAKDGVTKRTYSVVFTILHLWLGTSSSDWNDPANWAGGVPGSLSDIFIPIPTGLVAGKAGSENVLKTGPVSGPVIGAGESAECRDIEVSLGATLTILSDATGSGSLIVNGTFTGPGTVTYKRFMTGRITEDFKPWHLISSPVVGQRIDNFLLDETNAIAYTFHDGDQNNRINALAPYDNNIPAWNYFSVLNPPGESTFPSGKGYEVLRMEDGNLTFVGSLETGDVGIAITNPGGVGQWWNLIGNPYPSSLYATADESVTGTFLKTNEGKLEGAHVVLYIWNSAESRYDILNYTSEAYLAPCQAFFVCTETGGTANFTAAMRSVEPSDFKSGKKAWPSINLQANITGTNRNTKIFYIPGTTLGIDTGYDAGIFEDNNPAIALSTHIQGSEIDFGIQSLPDNDYENIVVPVGLNAPQGSTVSFTAVVANLPVGIKVYLEDRLTGEFIRLDQSGSFYSIDLSSATKGSGRFFLHTSQGITGIEEQVLSDIKVMPLPEQQMIRVLGTVEPSTTATLFDLNGRVLVSVTLQDVSDNEIPVIPLSSGIYMLKLQSGTIIKTEKINWVY